MEDDDRSLPEGSLEIEYEAHNYMSFSVRGNTEDQQEKLDELEEKYWDHATARREADSSYQFDDTNEFSFSLPWEGNTKDMARAMRAAADWLDAVGTRFPNHHIDVNVD